MIAFAIPMRNRSARLIVHKTRSPRRRRNPFLLGTQKCCDCSRRNRFWMPCRGGFDAAFGGARRDEENHARRTIYSFRDSLASGPQEQRPELWNIFNSRLDKAKASVSSRFRIGPSWTSGCTSTWNKFRLCRSICTGTRSCFTKRLHRRHQTTPRSSCWERNTNTEVPHAHPRLRSLHGSIRSEADTLSKIIEEMVSFRRSERENRAIDHDEEGSMELKKREGYF